MKATGGAELEKVDLGMVLRVLLHWCHIRSPPAEQRAERYEENPRQRGGGSVAIHQLGAATDHEGRCVAPVTDTAACLWLSRTA
jgi:hypothetical protein